jgi:formate hydrogenlyase subunit 6/NADH:ubiquinone oxidoreductase subunit I
MKFVIEENACVECGACRRYCPVDCIPYEHMQHQVNLEQCVGCTICYAVCPADAVLPVPYGRTVPDLSWRVMERVRLLAFKRGPRQLQLPR